MNKLLVHTIPSIVKNGNVVSVDEINSDNFCLFKHFEKDTVAQLGRWRICYKANPWTVRDLMIIDESEKYARSVSDLNCVDLQQLAEIIVTAINVLKGDSLVKMIVVGGNIYPYEKFSDPESIARLHLHVCAFTQEEINKFSKVPKKSFSQFNDKIIEDFISKFEISQNALQYPFGIKAEIDVINKDSLVKVLKDIDLKSISALDKINKTGRYAIASYSFAIKIDGGKVELFISAKSVNGRGVLESLGIVLKRDSKLVPDGHFYSVRNNFLKKVKEEILKNPEAKSGGAKLEENE